MRRASAIPATLLIALAAGLPAAATAGTTHLVSRTCIDDGVTTLTSLGVTCRRAHKIVSIAVRKSNCPPSPSFRGCYKTVPVGLWSCHGLFPGEGQSFTCRHRSHRIFSSGGG